MPKNYDSFVPLDEVNEQVVDDFVSLLAELSTRFAKNDVDTQREMTERNLVSALDAPNTEVLVYKNEVGRIISTLTGNQVAGNEAWVDDVVTHSTERGKGYGRQGMQALHKRFIDAGIVIVRLTSGFERDTAGNLYNSMGYREGGQVWRASLSEENATPIDTPEYFEPVICPIPTGNKSWLYESMSKSSGGIDLASDIRAANGVLFRSEDYNVRSVNYFIPPDIQPDASLLDVLKQSGFEQRQTRLYTRLLATIN